jgi:hypothetical protein
LARLLGRSKSYGLHFSFLPIFQIFPFLDYASCNDAEHVDADDVESGVSFIGEAKEGFALFAKG